MAAEYLPITLPGCEDLAEQGTGPRATAVDWATGEVFPVHPLAAEFPLLPDDELADLAADIKANGLQVPILLDQERQLIDGRNRLRGCEQAEVAPHYATFEGEDAAAAVIALNVHRRHLTEGQCAMGVAKERWSKLDQAPTTVREVAASAGVRHSRVAEATTILRYAPELASSVMHGGRLADAYAIAQERKRQKDADAANLKALKTQQPALAAQVEAGALTIGEAVAAARAIERTAAEEAEIARLRQAIDLAREEIGQPVSLPPPVDLSLAFTSNRVGAVTVPDYAPALQADALRAEQAFLRRLIGLRDEMQAVARETVIARPSWAEGHLNAVRSAAAGIVTAAYALVEAHEAALADRPAIREVK